ncbi:MAG: SDR family oxidoreductase [bacterium]|nr:SDR family oxidoreductase [bacterium]
MNSVNVNDLLSLKGKTALVTGGCRNFGWDMAQALAEAGANVAVTSRTIDTARRAADDLTQAHDIETLPLQMDLLDERSVERAFAGFIEAFGKLDILVNNAGGHCRATGILEQESLETWNGFMAGNLTGTFLCIREAARVMIGQGSGSIINIASVTSLLGRDRSVYEGTGMIPNPVPYTAAKAGVIGLTYDAAAYLGRYGIRVNAVSPGGFERGQPEAFIQGYSARTMLGRMGKQGSDLKGVAVFLASDAAGYITGHNLYVDGGFSRFK